MERRARCVRHGAQRPHLVLDLLEQCAPQSDDGLLALLARLLVSKGVRLLKRARLLRELDELLERLLRDQLVERVLALL